MTFHTGEAIRKARVSGLVVRVPSSSSRCASRDTTALAEPFGCACADNAAHGSKGSAESVDTRIFDVSDVSFLVDIVGVGARGLEEEGRAPVEFSEALGVDLGHLEDGYTEADDEETHHDGDDLHDGGFEAFEEDDSGDHGEEGEDNIIRRGDHGRVVHGEGDIEVVDFRYWKAVSRSNGKIGAELTKRDYHETQQEIDEPILELVVPRRRRDDRSPQTGGDADRQTANHAAHRDVPQHALLAVPRRKVEDNDQGGHDKDGAPCEEAWRQEELLEFTDLAHRRFVWPVKGDDHRPKLGKVRCGAGARAAKDVRCRVHTPANRRSSAFP